MATQTKSRVLGGLLAATLLGGASSAWAADWDVPEGTIENESGQLLYEHVTIAGTVRVAPYDGEHNDTGWLHVRAERIEITSTGVIMADDRGYRNTEATGPTGYESGAGQTPPDVQLPAPGGGGAHYGPGGSGANTPGCDAFAGALGGSSYDNESLPLGLALVGSNVATPDAVLRLGGLGSSGGSGRSASGAVGIGGFGGGMIILEAAQVVLDGQLTANGQDAARDSNGVGTSGIPAGGGAGGSVIIVSQSFTMGDGAGCSAKGGAGAINDAGNMLAVGGSGGGGRISLLVGSQHESDHLAKLDVSGGNVSAISGCSGTPSGGTGHAEIIDAPSPWDCVDADRDGYGSRDCGGEDCADADWSRNPDEIEQCDGIDQNCNDVVDEQLPETTSVCPQGFGHECVDAQCVPFISGEGEPTGLLRLGGGFCSARPGALAGGGAAGVLLGLLLTLGLRRRRRTEAHEPRLDG